MGRKYKAEMQSETQMATFQLTELSVWVRERGWGSQDPLIPCHEDPCSTDKSEGDPAWAPERKRQRDT